MKPATNYEKFVQHLKDLANGSEEKINLHTEERFVCPEHGVVRTISFVCPYC